MKNGIRVIDESKEIEIIEFVRKEFRHCLFVINKSIIQDIVKLLTVNKNSNCNISNIKHSSNKQNKNSNSFHKLQSNLYDLNKIEKCISNLRTLLILLNKLYLLVYGKMLFNDETLINKVVIDKEVSIHLIQYLRQVL